MDCFQMKQDPVRHPARRRRQTCDHPAKAGLLQALGVFIDTLVICSCTAMIMLLAPEETVTRTGRDGSAAVSYGISYGTVPV